MFLKDSVYSIDELRDQIADGDWWLVFLVKERINKNIEEILCWGKGTDLASHVRYMSGGSSIKSLITSYDDCLEMVKTNVRKLGFDFRKERLVVISRMSPGGYAKQEAFVGGIPSHLLQAGSLPDAEILSRSPRRNHGGRPRENGAAAAFEASSKEPIEIKRKGLDRIAGEAVEEYLIKRGLGVYLQKSSVYCIDEEHEFTGWFEEPMECCPNNPSHEISPYRSFCGERKFIALASSSVKEGEPLTVSSIKRSHVERSHKVSSVAEQKAVEVKTKKNYVFDLMKKRKAESDW